MTETELNVIAALAQIGLMSVPTNGYRTPAATGTPTALYDEGQEQVLADVPHRRAAQPARADDRAQIAGHERDAGALHRDVGAGSHRDADVRLRRARARR